MQAAASVCEVHLVIRHLEEQTSTLQANAVAPQRNPAHGQATPRSRRRLDALSAMAWSLIAAANRRSGFSTARAPLLVGQDSVAVAATIHAADGAAIEADEDLVLICE